MEKDYKVYIVALLRIMTAYSILIHPMSKIFGVPVDMTNLLTSWASLDGIATALELVGGILLILGIATRPTAFILSGLMAAAYFIAHFSFFPVAKDGEAAMLYSFVLMFITLFDGGVWSLGNRYKRNLSK
ncbi:DoxX family protein [Otariodibacter sp.]|uniref:DoxX family protein n=1 Tax=Otariodibacter sp. TaxID=3030919 RepID=UPI00262D6856|nr:DoxX family protein [Otariodibacter sp.]